MERTRGKAWLVDRARRLLAEWVVPHLCADKLGVTTGEQQLGSKTDHAT